MTLNSVIALIVRYFTESDRLGGRLRYTVIENIPIRFGAQYHLYVVVVCPSVVCNVCAPYYSAG